jgi:LacI family transcriptional regulator
LRLSLGDWIGLGDRDAERPHVASDGVADGEHAVEHLVAHGHRRAAFLGDLATISTAAERLHGYGSALDEAAIARDPGLVRQGLRSSDEATSAVAHLLSGAEPPTAIFASQNLVTIGAVRALHQLGQQHEVALVGFDDLPLVDLLDPGVTLVLQDIAGIGLAAADLLFRRIDGDAGPTERVILPTTLVPRGSGEILGPEATSINSLRRTHGRSGDR